MLIGREPELRLLQDAVTQALDGPARWLVIAGDAGIGKTRLAQHAAELAAQRGMRVAWGRCLEEPGAPPFLPWTRAIRDALHGLQGSDLAGALGAEAAAVVEIVPELAAHLPGRTALPVLTDGNQARFRLFMAVAQLWQRLAAQQPLLLILDNLHWADTGSLRLLGFLAGELAAQRICVLGTYRHGELSRQHPLSEALAELLRTPGFVRLPLAGFSRDETERFIASSAGVLPAPQVAAAMHVRTEGNPLFLVETLRFLLHDPQRRASLQGAADELPAEIPAGVREVIGQRLNRLSPDCCRLLQAAACVGRGFESALLAPLADSPAGETLLAALDEALAQHIIEALPAPGSYQFSHALIRETLYDELPASQRMRWHGEIAAALERRSAQHGDAGLAQLAWHCAQALPHADAAKALDYAERAARRAIELTAYEEAQRLYRLTLQLNERYFAGERRQRSELLLGLGSAQMRAGDNDACERTLLDAVAVARELGDATLFARAAIAFENNGWRIGRSGADAAALLEQALAQDAAPLDARLGVDLLAALCRAYAFSDQQAPAEDAHRRAVARARELGEAGALFKALTAILAAHYWPERLEHRLAVGREALALAQRAGHLEWIETLAGWHVGDLVEQGDFDEARAVTQIYQHVGASMRQPFVQTMALSCRTLLALYEGRFAGAERLASETYAIGRRFAADNAIGVYSVQMFTLRREQGRLGEVLPALRQLISQAPQASALWQPGLALIWAELGLLEEARDAFEPLAASGFAGIARDAMWLTNIAYLADVCVALADRPRAATLYRLLQPWAGRNVVTGTNTVCTGSADRLLGRLAALAGETALAARHFETAIATDARHGGRPWLAHTQHHYAVLLAQRRGGAARASVLLNAALETSRELGMTALEQRCLALQRRIGGRPDYPDGLSEREVGVLRLMAAGKSNREIAASLFISPNTVANHVRSILAKTGTVNRTEAAQYANRHRLTVADSPNP